MRSMLDGGRQEESLDAESSIRSVVDDWRADDDNRCVRREKDLAASILVKVSAA
ncbi:hypothetical protein LQL77_19055 [Rhodococcus cerastii]|uniref:hypothetical protein n=1 Tax=Rhodococcus erythropolis TaxID=1833 RepID=UPI001F400946|nr:hypothetical protein [Rhodococcus erythropolis]MCD2155828.1 hypothetical protein [Rhodococcus cerastii]